MLPNFRNQSVSTHQFAMVPRPDIPRSSFKIQTAHKTTFDAGYLIPVYVDEVLPGDTFNLNMTAFARMATPIVPIMDNLYLDSFFFFVPNRLLWDNWQKFMGERDKPGDSIDYVVPTLGIGSASKDLPVAKLLDYMGVDVASITGGVVAVNSLPLRAYNLIWNEWFRDENLQDTVVLEKGDSEPSYGPYYLKRRGKRYDYFTSALPWPQKGAAVPLPLTGSADIRSTGAPITVYGQGHASTIQNGNPNVILTSSGVPAGSVMDFGSANTAVPSMFADLSSATAVTINALRQAFQIQRLLERDARGGTRYTEIVRSHFGVVSPDARLQRPEYLGGGSTPVNISPIPQTGGTGTTGTTTPQGNLAAYATAVTRGHGFTQSFTEHGILIGLVSVRADLNYQQGIRRMWSRKTRYDFYFPAFAHLGEQAILNKEIYCDGTPADDDVFGYQERWAEYRYNPSLITGHFRSTTTAPLDVWHLAQKFNTRPGLNTSFIEENPPIDRVTAVNAGAGGAHFLFDSLFDIRVARPLPMYSVPGMIDHF